MSLYLDKLNENKDTLAEYQGLNPNRRLTMPELPRALETATSNEQIKGYAVSKAQPKGDPLAASTSAAMRRKNSLPENVQSAAVSFDFVFSFFFCVTARIVIYNHNTIE